MRRRIERDPASRTYSDTAIAPLAEDCSMALGLYTMTRN
jgi:hypothetical protein